MATTAANKNRAIRQEALREQLSQQKHVEQVAEIAEKLNKLDNELNALEIQRLRAAADIKCKLINKYLPDVKLQEITGKDGGAIEITGIKIGFKE